MNNKLVIVLPGLFLLSIVSFWASPLLTSIVGMLFLLLSLALSTYAVFQKHKGTDHARAKILKDAGVMVLTLIIVIFIGGIVSMLANAQVGARWGEVAGIISAIAASFPVGYLVRKGMVKFAG